MSRGYNRPRTGTVGAFCAAALVPVRVGSIHYEFLTISRTIVRFRGNPTRRLLESNGNLQILSAMPLVCLREIFKLESGVLARIVCLTARFLWRKVLCVLYPILVHRSLRTRFERRQLRVQSFGVQEVGCDGSPRMQTQMITYVRS